MVKLTELLKANDDWLREQIETELEKRTESAVWVMPDGAIHPSSAVHACSRYIALGMIGYRGKKETLVQRKMDNGTFMHSRWDGYLKEIPSFLAAEVPIRGDGVKGHCDLILKEPLRHRLIVGELKSIWSIGFNKLPEPGSDEQNMEFFKHMHPVYAAQIQLYMHNVVYEDYEPAQRGFFLFESKDTQQYKIYWVSRNTELLDSLILNARMAQSALDAKKLPAPEFAKTDKICKTCDKKQVCFLLQDGDTKMKAIIDKRIAKL